MNEAQERFDEMALCGERRAIGGRGSRSKAGGAGGNGMRIAAVPITLKTANEFIVAHHRHSLPCQGHKFAVGATINELLIGVGVAGRPVSRILDDGATLEILRVCTNGTPNAGSFIYARLKRIGQLMGYQKFTTSTLAGESGSTLRAVGAVIVGESEPREWSRPKRSRKSQAVYGERKLRWNV